MIDSHNMSDYVYMYDYVNLSSSECQYHLQSDAGLFDHEASLRPTWHRCIRHIVVSQMQLRSS